MLEYQNKESAPAAPATVRPAAPAHRSAAVRRLAPIILALFDLGVVYLAFLAAYWTRYDLRLGPHIRDQLGFDAYFPLLLPLLALMLVALWAKGAYRLRLGNELQDDFTVAFSAATISVATIVILAAMLQQYQYSRGVMIYLWVALILFLIVGRWLFRLGMTHLYRRGIGSRRLLVVGATDVGKMIMQGVAGRRDLGYELVGFVHTRLDGLNGKGMEPSATPADFGRFRNLGYAPDVPALLERERIDEVIIALPASAHQEIWPILQQCDEGGIGFKIVPDTFELSLGRVQVDDIAGIPVLDVREQPLKRFKLAMKKATDLSLAVLLGVVFSPVLIVTAILVKLDSPGPVFFAQQRVGQGGRRFTCYKFRSMRKGSEDLITELHPFNEAKGPLYKMRDDPRLTRVGRFIRRHSIDELPQLWNVLKGDMSIVGPRPAIPQEVSQYEPWHNRRFETRPGMTGIWQVSGRSDLTFDEMVMMDIYYIQNWSLLLDIKILLRTVACTVTASGAY